MIYSILPSVAYNEYYNYNFVQSHLNNYCFTFNLIYKVLSNKIEHYCYLSSDWRVMQRTNALYA